MGSVSIEGTPAINHSGPRHWLNYKLVLNVVGTDRGAKAFAGLHVTCTPADYASVLTWDATRTAWVVDDSAVRNVNETSVCTVAP